MNNRKGLIVLALIILLAVVVVANRGRIHFDWAVFWQQLRHLRWIHILFGTALPTGSVQPDGPYFSHLRRRCRCSYW
jgi:hypothetical protein